MKHFGCQSKELNCPKEDNVHLLEKLEKLKNDNAFLASKLEEKEVHDTLKNFTGSINEKKLLAQIAMLEGINSTLQERVNYLEKDGELLLQNSTVYHTQNRLYEEELRRLRNELDILEFEHEKLKLNIEGRNKVASQVEEKLNETLSRTDDFERLKILSEIENKEKQIKELESQKNVSESDNLPASNPVLERKKFNKKELENSEQSNDKKKVLKRASWKN